MDFSRTTFSKLISNPIPPEITNTFFSNSFVEDNN